MLEVDRNPASNGVVFTNASGRIVRHSETDPEIALVAIIRPFCSSNSSGDSGDRIPCDLPLTEFELRKAPFSFSIITFATLAPQSRYAAKHMTHFPFTAFFAYKTKHFP
ncbi:hypothetical protein SBA3_790010 [Candidatus Sulfopaludibacter sp. SbA3]|nr:hypothetical protein SBA3_790010 [Candidatus Sulfopaludibacter sp. SbA3]